MKKLWICLLLVVCCISMVGCDSKEKDSKTDENQKQSSQQEDTNNQKEENDSLGYVEKETVSEMVTKLNTKIVNDSGLGPVSVESVTSEDTAYRYEITDGLSLVVVPEKMTGSKEEDIVLSMHISVEKEYQEDPQVLSYTNLLIMTNNSAISYEEAQDLIEKARTLASEQLSSNNGKGISVRYLETDDSIEYQVIRNYQ